MIFLQIGTFRENGQKSQKNAKNPQIGTTKNALKIGSGVKIMKFQGSNKFFQTKIAPNTGIKNPTFGATF